MAQYEVNIDLANQTKREMASIIDSVDSRVLNKVGAFSSLFELNLREYQEPILVLKTEEPGSKQLLAMQYNRIEGVCHDMINHLVNDCIVMGATPLTVQDAIICGKLDKKVVTRIVKSLADACKNNDCLLTGGETSEQPGVLNKDTYILTSSIVGIVEKKRIIDGAKIRVGDKVLALASSGLHTNGYTLVRDIMNENPDILNMRIGEECFIDAVLRPHRAYYSVLKDLFTREVLHGLAHITGGGICENLNRVLPANVDAEIDMNLYQIPEIFCLLQKVGHVSGAEMLRTFNLGVGIVAVVAEENENMVIEHCMQRGVKCFPIGKIVCGAGNVKIKNSMVLERPLYEKMLLTDTKL